MDIDSLLPPLSDEAPCGPDADDFDTQPELYSALSQLETMISGEVRNGTLQPPRWAAIQEEALKLAAQSKHLRLAVILTESACLNEGLEGFRDGLRLLHEWVDAYWPHLYPREIRHTLIDSLSTSRFLVKPCRLILASGVGGSYSFEDLDSARVNLNSSDSEQANQARLVVGVFQSTPREKHARNHAALTEALEHAHQIENIFDDRGGSDDSVNLADLRDCLKRMATALEPYATEPETTAVTGNSGGGDSAPGSGPSSRGESIEAFGSVDSRKKAAEQLEQIAQFFERNEPSSPIPFMLRRAKRCIGKNFMELIHDLSTDAANAKLILSPEEGSENSVTE
jgi:type VI secretion system protein ImpA